MNLKYYFKIYYSIIPIIYKYLKYFISFKEKYLFNKSTHYEFDTIYKKQHKDKIDKLLFKISKDIDITKYTDDADYIDDNDTDDMKELK